MPAKHPDKCHYPKCNNWSDLIYLDKPLCDKHWAMIDTNPDLLREKLGLPPYPKPKPKRSKFDNIGKKGRVRLRINR